ncbi:MAG: hypothetical protein HND39_13340 [Ignavibacteriota bacterium]|nr:hypothetical protein [Ignavibacteriales bacterium]MCZ7613332.1 hypothetical protein [Ignavibacteriaceae bacterium]MEB2295393.1 hypothetical protein [Ignavibacteria bacterium]QKJ97189.1 MAG: hypothetical protein HND39_13340 [Ignavibacteriota bacterium]NUM61825.1 hypothetical protein [Ignavibacteriaceae bacterium]
MNNVILIAVMIAIIPLLNASNDMSNAKQSAKIKSTEKNIIGPEYFPINTSLKLVYNSSMGEAYSTVKKNGKNFTLDLWNDDFYFNQTVQVTNDTIYLTKLDQNVDVFLFISSSSSVTYNKPYLRFPFPLKKNDTWNWEGVEYIDEANPDTINVSGRVIGNETIVVEAGKFECVKFQIDIHKKKRGTHTKFYEWRTPKIGLVKLEAFIDSKGFIGTIMNLLGYDEMMFELKEII